MKTRAEHLAWCKRRALEYVDAGDPSGAMASMMADLNKWDGGPLYDPVAIRILCAAGISAYTSTAAVRTWIEGFS